MGAHKLSIGERISAASAVLLFVAMFLDWFGAEVSGVAGFSGSIEGGGGGASAWDALDAIPAFLMLAIVLALGVALVRLTDADLELSISLNAFVAAAGALAFLLILYRIVFPPDFGIPGVAADTTLKLGVFLGLVAAAGIAYGGWSAMREEGLTFDDQAERLSK
ncbi:MAG TPA: hypothetical protein VFG58_02820 [Solirubrobacterales bacterium]|nr:hypothetical protein [Solirubrobacterales bacterium]